MGSVEILIIAKKLGMIEKLKPILDKLRNDGFWLSNNIYEKVIKKAREI